MKKLLVSALLCLLAFPALAQTPVQGRIDVVRRFGENTFTVNHAPVTRGYAKDLLLLHPEAWKEMRKANTCYGFALTFAVIGGAGIGWSAGSALGGDFQWEPLAAGAGALLIMIPFMSGYNKHSARAVDIYNTGGLSSGFRRQKPFVALSDSGLGLALRF